MFSLICGRINGWVNNSEAGDLRRYRVHCDVMVMLIHKSQHALVPYPTILHSEQKCAHSCSEWSIVGYGTGAFWNLWNWSILISYFCYEYGCVLFSHALGGPHRKQTACCSIISMWRKLSFIQWHYIAKIQRKYRWLSAILQYLNCWRSFALSHQYAVRSYIFHVFFILSDSCIPLWWLVSMFPEISPWKYCDMLTN